MCDGAIMALACLQAGGSPATGRGSSSTARPDRSARRPCSWPALRRPVTAVCDTRNLELVRSLGADEVIDYTAGGLHENGETYDVIFDAVGQAHVQALQALAEAGRHLPHDRPRVHVARAGPDPADPLRRRQAGHAPDAAVHAQDVLLLKELIEAGEYRAVIDRALPAGGRGRGDQVRRDRAEDGQRRPDRRTRRSLPLADEREPLQQDERQQQQPDRDLRPPGAERALEVDQRLDQAEDQHAEHRPEDVARYRP